MKLKKCIRRLILIESGSHRFSDFPLDEALSIYGRNNMGKSQTINALQFLFFGNTKQMDFGDYDSNKSREFYFKSDFSIIMAEIMTDDGVFLIGAAGKGPLSQHEYYHFVIKSPYRREDFFDGDHHMKAKDIIARFERRGIPVYRPEQDKIKHALCGNPMAAGIPFDITLVPIKDASETRIAVFRQIYRNLLTMRKISDREVKNLVLEVFSNALANTKVDFNKVKGEAFREHDSLSQEIDTLDKITPYIEKLVQQRSRRDESHQALVEIKTRLLQVSGARLQKIPEAIAAHNQSKQECETFIANARNIYNILQSNKNQSSTEFAQVAASLATIAKGTARFELLSLMGSSEPEVLLAKMDEQANQLLAEYSTLQASISTSADKSASALRAQIDKTKKLLSGLEREYEIELSNDSWLYRIGISHEDQLDLGRVLSSDLINLPAASITDDDGTTDSLNSLVQINGDTLKIGGIELDISSIKKAPESKSPEEMGEEIKAYKSDIKRLENDLGVAVDLDAARKRLATIQRNLAREVEERNDYVKHLENLKSKPDLLDRFDILQAQVAALDEEMANHSEKQTAAQNELHAIEKRIKDLATERTTLNDIGTHSFYRDQSIEFSGEAFFDEGATLDLDHLQSYIADANSQYGRLCGSRTEIRTLLDNILREYSKHAGEESEADIIRKLKDELDSIPEKITMLGNLHQEAVIKMANALSTLHKNYTRLESQVADFNRRVNGKKVSNLKSFKIKLLPNQKAIDSIQTIISSMEDTNTVLDMFSSTSKADKIDQTIQNDAIRYLGAMVNELSDGLTLASIFELGFEIVDVNGKENVYTSLDGHASNGTTMTIKSLFNMNLLRSLYDTRASTTYLPFYIDEATNIDDTNRQSLTAMSNDLGFTPVFASVDPVITAKYAINLEEATTDFGLIVPEEAWIRIHDKEEAKPENQLDLI